MEGIWVNFPNLVQFFRFLKGRCHGNQFYFVPDSFARSQSISGSAGPIFTIYAPYCRYWIADERYVLLGIELLMQQFQRSQFRHTLYTLCENNHDVIDKTERKKHTSVQRRYGSTSWGHCTEHRDTSRPRSTCDTRKRTRADQHQETKVSIQLRFRL